MKTGIKKTEQIKSIVISIIGAALIWAAVIYINPPEMTTTISNLPVRITGEQALKDKDLTVVNLGDISGLAVTVKGMRDDLLHLSGGIYVDVDVSSVTQSGSYDLTGNVTLPSSKLTVESVKFDSVPIEVEPIIEKDIDIRILSSGDAGNRFVDLSADTEAVTVRGAKSEIDMVSYGLATVDVSNIHSDTFFETGYMLMSSEDNLISKNETIKASKTHIMVSCTVYDAVTVPVEVELSEELSQKYVLDASQTSANPASVKIGVRQDLVLRAAKAVISQIAADTTAKIEAGDGLYIPDDVKTVKVKLAVDKKVEKKVAVNVELRNLGNGLSASVTPISVTASGADKDLTAENITAYVDLSGYGAGTYTVPVTLKSDKVAFAQEYSVTVTIN